MKYLNLFKTFEKLDNTIKLDINKILYDDGYKIYYELYFMKNYIGKCEVESSFTINGFDDTIDSLYFSKRKFDYKNPVKKNDYNKYPFIVEINGFEIEPEFRKKGLGLLSFNKILESIQKNFPNNNGIYLSVFSNNLPAIKIYKKTGFKTIKKEDNILTMKLKKI